MIKKKCTIMIVLLLLLVLCVQIVMSEDEIVIDYAVNEANFATFTGCTADDIKEGGWLTTKEELKRYFHVQGKCWNLDDSDDHCAVLVNAERFDGTLSGWTTTTSWGVPFSWVGSAIFNTDDNDDEGDDQYWEGWIKFDDILGHKDNFTIYETNEGVRVTVSHEIITGVASKCNYFVRVSAQDDEDECFCTETGGSADSCGDSDVYIDIDVQNSSESVYSYRFCWDDP